MQNISYKSKKIIHIFVSIIGHAELLYWWPLLQRILLHDSFIVFYAGRLSVTQSKHNAVDILLYNSELQYRTHVDFLPTIPNVIINSQPVEKLYVL